MGKMEKLMRKLPRLVFGGQYHLRTDMRGRVKNEKIICPI